MILNASTAIRVTPAGGLFALIALATSGAVAQAQGSESDGRGQSEEIRHVVLMLHRAPVFARFRLSLAGLAPDAARESYIDSLIESLDSDGDGEITREEASQSPLLRRKDRPGAREFLRTLNVKQSVSRRDIARRIDQLSGLTVSYRQNDNASDSDRLIFELLDADGSGVIDHDEMASAPERLKQRDRDLDECVGFDEIQPPAPEPDPQLTAARTEPPPPRASFSNLLRDTNEPLLPRRLLRKYDRNGNRKLSQAELGWTAERLALLDRSGDGQLSVTELRRLEKIPVDLDLLVDVAPSDPARPKLQILSCEGTPDQRVVRPGMATLRLQGVTVTFSYRHVEPVASAVDNAMRRFNVLDADGNGYLDPPEIQRDVRLRRGLFEMIDADGDEKLFGEEMETYTRLRAAPDATSCRVTVYDTGSGFFQALDHNNDGRISVREMRKIDDSLQSMARDDKPGVSIQEPSRRFHIEFVRGSFRMFGSANGTVDQVPSFNTHGGTGPIWFQAWDRNNDGDLTWREFQGPREAFYQLDQDRDELLDPLEAAKAADL